MLARPIILAGLLIVIAGALRPAHALPVDPAAAPFRVCADPNDMPFSNRDGNGFENRLAAFVASKLGTSLAFVWQPQRGHSITRALDGDRCDAMMGVPADLGSVATTRPYYRSTYVFVTRAARGLDISSISDPRLRRLRIGAQLLGNRYNTPPAHALGDEGVVDNVVGFPVFAYSNAPNPAARIMTAVETRQVDIATVWGPLAGYFAKTSLVPLRLVPMTGVQPFAPLRFRFGIAMGVRKNDAVLRAKLDGIVGHYQRRIDALLASYGVPLLPLEARANPPASAPVTANERRQ